LKERRREKKGQEAVLKKKEKRKKGVMLSGLFRRGEEQGESIRGKSTPVPAEGHKKSGFYPTRGKGGVKRV